jgi:hypothetical protein
VVILDGEAVQNNHKTPYPELRLNLLI